jgi:hypothetical protein
MSSHINIGLRHVLPMYAGLAVLGGAAATEMLRHGRWSLIIVAALLGWMAVTSLVAHPDYLAYFNEIASGQPEKFLVDSDLDWGQDVGRLGRRLHELGADQVTFVPGDEIDLHKQPGFEGIKVSYEMSWALPTEGWNAIGATTLKHRLGFFNQHPELTMWPEVLAPRERVGRSILLWYFPRHSSAPTLPPGGAGK